MKAEIASSVAATTASHAGSLLPAMGIGGDSSQIQDANLRVVAFIFCDTIHFVFAVVVITFSLGLFLLETCGSYLVPARYGYWLLESLVSDRWLARPQWGPESAYRTNHGSPQIETSV